MIDQFIFLPAFSLEPNKLSMYNRVFLRSKLAKDARKGTQMRTGLNCACVKDSFTADDLKSYPIHKQTNAQLEITSKNKVTRAFHNFEISVNANRTLKKKINWLYYMAKAKSVRTYSGKHIFNFKMAFLTLTLPSKQKEPTVDITKKLFNQLLTEVRQRTGMANYVWRLEFQKNGNVHYHIATDTYLDYFFLKQIWNRILNKAGYIAPYTKKHKSLSLSQYNEMYNSDKKTDFSVMAKRYARGCADGWSNPNTVDAISVVSNKSIASYISKYFSKDTKGKTICNEHDTPENSKSLRLWFCSRSISKLNSVSDFCEAVDYDVYSLVLKSKEIHEIVFKWAKIIYFEIKSFYHRERAFIEQLLTNYAKKTGYLPSI